jgi:hypothetical protein
MYSFSHPKIHAVFLHELMLGETQGHTIYSTKIKDEFAFKMPDHLMNGMAISTIIKSCIPDIEDPSSLPICDLQHIMACIYLASDKGHLEVDLNCVKCKEYYPYTIDLTKYMDSFSAKMWYAPIFLGALKINIAPPTIRVYNEFAIQEYRVMKQLDQISKHEEKEKYYPLAKQLLEKKETLKWNFCLDSITSIGVNGKLVTEKEYIQDWFDQCGVIEKTTILDHINLAMKQTSLPEINTECSTCKSIIKSSLNLDFCEIFRHRLIAMTEEDIIRTMDKMGKENKKITQRIMEILWAMRGALSYDEAMNLTSIDMECINKVIEQNIENTTKSKMPLL